MSPPRSGLLGRVLGEGLLAHRRSLAVALAVTAAALCLAGCGRKGELELPPGPATQPPVAAAPISPSFLPSSPSAQQQQDATAVKNGFDAQGNPVATPGERKPFLLDPLLR
jgi:predicted small lipoprotein YifL